MIYLANPMKILFVILSFVTCCSSLRGQNSVGLQAGYQYTYTKIAEYLRPGQNFYFINYVTLNQARNSIHAAITIDIDLGKRFFLSTGFHYAEKGLTSITYTDTLNVTLIYRANKPYLGVSTLLKYRYVFGESKFGVFLSSGPKIDFAIGYLNIGEQSIYRGSDFIVPFARFNQVDFTWATELGVTYSLGPGDLMFKISYMYGLSDVLKDDYTVGKTGSFGIDVGYSFRLSGKD